MGDKGTQAKESAGAQTQGGDEQKTDASDKCYLFDCFIGVARASTALAAQRQDFGGRRDCRYLQTVTIGAFATVETQVRSKPP